MDIKLAAFDLDGTLLKNDKTLSPATLAAIKSAAQRGIVLVPVTGRPLSGLPSAIIQIPEIRYVVTTNGAVITDLKSGAEVYHAPISAGKSLEILRLLRAGEYACEVFADGVGYTEPAVFEQYMQKYSGTPVGDYIASSRRVTENICALFEEKNKCADEVFVQAPTEEMQTELRGLLGADPALRLCLFGGSFAEVTAYGTDKGSALHFLCKLLGIKREQTIAFGDMPNDLSLLKAAGVSVAMGNAQQELKNCADIVAETNENDGVAKVLNNL